MALVEHWWVRWERLTGKPVPDALKVNHGSIIKHRGYKRRPKK